MTERLTMQQVRQWQTWDDESCRRCDGSGELYADGRAHYPTEHAPTCACMACGGTGRTSPHDETEVRKRLCAEIVRLNQVLAFWADSIRQEYPGSSGNLRDEMTPEGKL